MNFTEWVMGGWFQIDDFFENVGFKRNVTRDKAQVLAQLQINLKRMVGGSGAATVEHLLTVIRHDFTTYNEAWRSIDASKAKLGLVEYIRQWNAMVEETFQLVNQFIGNYLPDQQAELSAANIEWRASHLKQMPAGADEEDDDPRQWRSGWKR